jgi:hypothetical protein
MFPDVLYKDIVARINETIMYIYMCVCIYIYIEREREGE